MDFRRFFIPALIPIFVLAFLGPVNAMSNNKVRVEDFDWVTVETDHFIIHYDEEDKALVPYMAQYLEGAWNEVGEDLNYFVEGKTPFFFYANHNEFEQTNIVSVGEGTGGVTEAFKNRFLIYNDGSQAWMKHVIYHEFAHVVQFNVLYGGFWKSIRLLKSPFYPLWFMEGMAEYASGDVDDPTGDMVIRDAVYHGILPNLPELQGFGHLKPNQVTLAYKTGDAAMNFLADEFGEEKVGEILMLIKDYFDISAALNKLLGTDLFRFDFRFQEWLRDKYHDFFAASKTAEEYGPDLNMSDQIPQFNQAPVFHPDGKSIFYISDRKGPTTIYQMDLATKKLKRLLHLTWGPFENVHSRGRAMSISRDGRYLAFAGEKKQRDFLYLYDLEKKDLKKIKVPFDQIRDPVFSPVDDTLVVVAMNLGFNDLFRITNDGQLIERLTENHQDESGPTFSPDGKKLIFSGEMMNADRTEPLGRDLFVMDLETKESKRVTNLLGDETEPEWISNDRVVYVRNMDDDGNYIFDLFELNLISGESTRQTHMVGGAFTPRLNPESKDLYYVAYNRGERHIFKLTDWNLQTLTNGDSGEDLGGESIPVTPPSTHSIETNSNIPISSTTLAAVRMARSDFSEDDFYGPRREKEVPITYALDRWDQDIESPYLLAGPQPYRFRGSTDLFLPFFYYSSLDGLVLADIWQASDYLGNHQMQQQMQYASGNDYIDLAMFYTYSRFRPQFTIGFRNYKYYEDIDKNEQRRVFDAIGLMSYPLDRVNSVFLGVGGTDESERYINGIFPEDRSQNRFYVTGYTHDTVTGRYLVATKGRRLSVAYQEGVEAFGGREDYKTISAQGVQYVPLPRESTMVGRLLYGRSTGEDPQVFRLGGVDRVRGVSRGSLENKKENVVLGSLESRVRLKYLNWRTKFLFPDFFFKAAYLVMFTDAGVGWNSGTERDNLTTSDVENSIGAGISWPTFILQTFQLNLTVQWARHTNDGSEIWYVTVGPTF